MRSVARAAALLIAIAVAAPASAAKEQDFESFLYELASEALERGISQQAIDHLAALEPDPRVLDLDGSQPSKTDEFCDYLDRRLTDTRIRRARALLSRHASLLARLEDRYGVPPRYLVSLWGLESDFGRDQGDFEVVRALATLAHDPRRAGMFRAQLFAALQILDEGDLEPSDMKGSWAGAMGQVQFMPSTYRNYAVDYDGDGRRDIWGSVPDALASAANYLDQAGWRGGQSWGRPVRIPDELPGLRAGSNSSSKASVSQWRRRGVRRHDGRALPRARLTGRIVLPSPGEPPAFLVYRNYETLLRWNRSIYFGLSVGTLADHITRRSAPVCG